MTGRWLTSLTLLGYLKKVVEKLKEGGADDDKIKAFQKKVQGYYTSKIAPNFFDFDFYTGESMDPDGMYASRDIRCVNWTTADSGMTGSYY